MAFFFGFLASARQCHAHFKQSEKVEADDKEQQDQEKYKAAVLHLKSPVEIGITCFERNNQTGKRSEGSQYAAGIRQTVPQSTTLPCVCLTDEALNFQCQHRKDAGHEVENQTANKHIKNRHPKA